GMDTRAASERELQGGLGGLPPRLRRAAEVDIAEGRALQPDCRPAEISADGRRHSSHGSVSNALSESRDHHAAEACRGIASRKASGAGNEGTNQTPGSGPRSAAARIPAAFSQDGPQTASSEPL